MIDVIITPDRQVLVIDGGIVTCVEGLRVWARRVEDGRELLLLYETAHPKV